MAVVRARVVARWLGGLLVAALLVVAPAGPARAAVTQGIQGTVTGDGNGLGNVGVWVVPVDPSTPVTGDISFSPCDIECDVFEVDSGGNFAFHLPAGEYWLLFTPTAGGDWAPEWWQDSPTREGSTKVTVAADTMTTVDPVLDHGGAVAGTIAQVDGTDDDVLVEAWLPDATMPSGFHRVAIGKADAEGHYRVDWLPTASGYRLHFLARKGHLEGWWQDAGSPVTAAPIAVDAPKTVTGIDPELDPWGTVTGRVTRAADGSAVAGAWVSGTFLTSYAGQRDAATKPDGTFTLPLPAGSWSLRFHGEGLAVRVVTPTTVTLGEQTTVDAVLEPTALVNLTRPSVVGTPRVGSTLTAKAGAWYPSGGTLARQWLRDGSPVAGATGATYPVGVADLGHRISVRVTVSRTGYATTKAGSDPTEPVARGVFRLGSTAVVRGTLRVGERLVAVPPTTTPSAARTYRWLRNGSPIAGATSSAYRLTRADRGTRIAVRITLTRPGYVTRVLTVTRTGLVR